MQTSENKIKETTNERFVYAMRYLDHTFIYKASHVLHFSVRLYSLEKKRCFRHQ
jgi:hypothetical protein